MDQTKIADDLGVVAAGLKTVEFIIRRLPEDPARRVELLDEMGGTLSEAVETLSSISRDVDLEAEHLQGAGK